ncbi:tetratricopeptide repeat protein [Rasiella sp. SM2506]|uniref:tetratricopeptide repeat protein n=1 Tax=Rasiella sp. SM2506 TaxID=3423914 RepID=UPI003D796820
MHKNFLGLFLLFSCIGILNAQETKIDRLQKELAKNPSVEEKIEIYRAIKSEFYHAQIYYDSAFFYIKKGYELAKNNDLILQQSQTLFDYGMIYGALEEWDDAIAYYKKSIEFSEKANYKRGVSSAYRNIGIIYSQKKNYTLAKEYHLKSMAIGNEIHYAKSIAVGHLNLGEISFFEKDYEHSKLLIESSQYIFDSLGYTPPQAYTYLSKTLYSLGDLEEAEKQALKGFALSEKEGDLKSSYENAITLSKVYATKKKFENANLFTNKAMVYHDSILNSKKLNEIEKLELRFKLNEREEKIAALEEKNVYLNIIYFLGAVGVLLLIILAFRQLKIARMTQDVHEIQNRLIKHELDLLDKKDMTSFEATVAGDNESLSTSN